MVFLLYHDCYNNATKNPAFSGKLFKFFRKESLFFSLFSGVSKHSAHFGVSAECALQNRSVFPWILAHSIADTHRICSKNPRTANRQSGDRTQSGERRCRSRNACSSAAAAVVAATIATAVVAAAVAVAEHEDDDQHNDPPTAVAECTNAGRITRHNETS